MIQIKKKLWARAQSGECDSPGIKLWAILVPNSLPESGVSTVPALAML